MSYFDDASLVMIPSGYKTSKVYSVKPTDGTGDLTFTRSNDTATRVGPDGLIEKVRTNLILQSQNLASASWSLGGTATRTANYGIAPDGTQTTTRIQWTNAAGFELFQYTGVAAPVYGSIFIKGTAGQTIKYSGTSVTLNGSFQRIEGLIAVDGANTFLTIAGTAGTNTAFDFELWGAQAETGDIATPYIPTTTAAVSVGMLANVPRLDYTGGGCPKLLLEPQRVNLITFSEQINNAAWTKQAGATITANSVISPDGTQNADTLNVTTSAYSSVYNTTPYSASSGVYTQSIYAKKGTKNWLYILDLGASSAKAWFNLDTGVVGTVASGYTATIQNAGNGWYRCILTETTNRLPLYFHFGASDADNSFTPSSAGTAFIWGCQVEQGAFATSYIPTLGAAVTRSVDAASKTGISALIGQTEGTLFCEVSYKTLASTARFITISNGTVNNLVQFYLPPNLNTLLAYIAINGTVVFNGNVKSLTNINAFFKIAMAYKNGNTRIYVDGQLLQTITTSFSSGTFDRINFGNQTGGQAFEGEANSVLIFPTALSNSDLAALTA